MTVGGRVAWTVAVGLLVGLAARPTLAGDRSRAQRLIAEAQQSTGELRTNLLRQSLAEEDSYTGRMMLAASLAEQGLEAAIEEAKEALGKAGTDAEAVKARWLLARIYEALGRPLAAVQELDAMRSLPLPTEMARKREERAIALADEVPTVAEIEDLLVATRDVPLRTRPAVAIRIHFDTDQAKLSDRGQLEVSKLVDAMRSGRLAGQPILLVGHTDSTGDEAHNDDLSRRRAEEVRRLLVVAGVDSASITTDGRGERELAYQGETADIHALNRRVEVKVLDAGN